MAPPQIQLSTDGFTWQTAGVKQTFSASSTVYARLESIANVDTVAWDVEATDGTSATSSFTLTQSGIVGQNVQLTADILGTAGRLRAVINSGVDKTTGNVNLETTTARVKWVVLAANGAEVGTFNETLESGPLGMTPNINGAIRGAAGPTTFTQGPLTRTVFTGTTTGTGTATLSTLTLAASKLVGFEFSVTGYCAALPGAFAAGTVPATIFSTFSPVGLYGATGNVFQSMGITPAVVSSWSAGTLTITAYGPSATITGIADNGSGKCRVTVGNFHLLGPLDNTLTGQSVTISGVVGTTEANGPHVATFVDETHFDLLTVSFVHAYVSGGTAVHTTAPVITWAGWVQTTTPA